MTTPLRARQKRLSRGPRARRGRAARPVARADARVHAVTWSATTAKGATQARDAVPAFGDAARSLGDLTARGRAALAAEDAKSFETLLAWDDGPPFVARRTIGRGGAWVVTLPFAVSASDLTVRPGFLALLDAWTEEARGRVVPLRVDVGRPWTFTAITRDLAGRRPAGPARRSSRDDRRWRARSRRFWRLSRSRSPRRWRRVWRASPRRMDPSPAAQELPRRELRRARGRAFVGGRVVGSRARPARAGRGGAGPARPADEAARSGGLRGRGRLRSLRAWRNARSSGSSSGAMKKKERLALRGSGSCARSPIALAGGRVLGLVAVRRTAPQLRGRRGESSRPPSPARASTTRWYVRSPARAERRGGTVVLFGVVVDRGAGPGGSSYLALSVRRLEPRNLCENAHDDDTCRVTVSAIATSASSTRSSA